MGKITQYAFWLSLVLILVVYFQGSSSLLSTMTDGANRLILSLTGRKETGDFANYPK